VFANQVLQREGQSDALQRGVDDLVETVDHELAIDAHIERPAILLEIPHI
jgi:hypothetical protein